MGIEIDNAANAAAVGKIADISTKVCVCIQLVYCRKRVIYVLQ